MNKDIKMIIGGNDFFGGDNGYPSFQKEEMSFVAARISRAGLDGYNILSSDWLCRNERRFRLFFVLSRECPHIHHFALCHGYYEDVFVPFQMRLMGNLTDEYAGLSLKEMLALLAEFAGGNLRYDISMPQGGSAYDFLFELMDERDALTADECISLKNKQFQEISSPFQLLHYTIMALFRNDEFAAQYLASPQYEDAVMDAFARFPNEDIISATYEKRRISDFYDYTPVKTAGIIDMFHYTHPHIFRDLNNPIYHELLYNKISSFHETLEGSPGSRQENDECGELEKTHKAYESQGHEEYDGYAGTSECEGYEGYDGAPPEEEAETYRCKSFMRCGSELFWVVLDVELDSSGIRGIKQILLTKSSDYELELHASAHDFVTICELNCTKYHALGVLEKSVLKACVPHEEKTDCFFLPQSISDRVFQPVFNALESYLFAIHADENSHLILHASGLNGIGFAEMIVLQSPLAEQLKIVTRRELIEPVFLDYVHTPDMDDFIFYAEELRGYSLIDDPEL